MSSSASRWKQVGGINRSARHQIVKSQEQAIGHLNILDSLGSTNTNIEVFSNLSMHSNIYYEENSVNYDNLIAYYPF